MIHVRTSTVILMLGLIVTTVIAVRAHSEIRTLRGRVDVIDVRRVALDGYVFQLNVPTSVRAELDACRDRTAHLRATLETLVRIYPNWRRERLPDPPPGWQPWPTLGEARTWDGVILAPPRTP